MTQMNPRDNTLTLVAEIRSAMLMKDSFADCLSGFDLSLSNMQRISGSWDAIASTGNVIITITADTPVGVMNER